MAADLTVEIEARAGTGSPPLWSARVTTSRNVLLSMEYASFSAALAALRATLDEWERHAD